MNFGGTDFGDMSGTIFSKSYSNPLHKSFFGAFPDKNISVSRYFDPSLISSSIITTNVLSASHAEFSGSVLIYGTASLASNPTAAYLKYKELPIDKIEIFPGLLVSGSTVISGNLNVGGNAIVNQNVTISGNSYIVGNEVVVGDIMLDIDGDEILITSRTVELTEQTNSDEFQIVEPTLD